MELLGKRDGVNVSNAYYIRSRAQSNEQVYFTEQNIENTYVLSQLKF